MRRHIEFAAYACGILLWSSSPSLADELDRLLPLSLAELMQQKVVTASRDVEEIGSSPAHMVVITRQQILAHHYRNLVDVLDTLPGFHIQRHTTNTRYHRIGWRGHFMNNRFIIMLDGVRITDPSGSSIAITDNFSLAHIQRIEVLYGPASALYGADAVAGVINLIPRTADSATNGEFQLQQGSFHYDRIEGVVRAPLGERASLTISGHRYRDDTANLAAYYPQDFRPVDATTFNGTVVVPASRREPYIGPVSANSAFALLDAGHGLRFGMYRNRDVHLTSTGDRPSGVIMNPASIWQQDITTLYARKSWVWRDGLTSTTTINGSRLEISPTSSYQNIFVDFQSTYKYMRNDRLEWEQNFAWELGARDRLHFGFSLGQFASIPKTPDLPHPIDPNINLAAQTMFYPNTTIPMTLYDLHYRHQGLYLQSTHHWSANTTTTAGLRYDFDSRYGGSWNPRLSLVYRPPASDWSWKLMYGEAFRAPSTFESYETFGSFSGATNAAGQFTTSFFHLANPNLKPEKTRTLESTWQGAPTPSLFLGISAYLTQVDNLIFTTQATDPNLTLPGASIAYVETTANLGTERFYGGELSLRYEWFAGDLRGEFSGSYSFIDGTLNQGGGKVTADLPFVAKHHLRLQGLCHWKGISLGATMHFVGKTSSNTIDPLNPSQTVKVPGYSVLDLQLRSPSFFDLGELEMDIFNALDRRYYHSNGSGIRFLRAQQQPRSIVLGLHMRL